QILTMQPPAPHAVDPSIPQAVSDVIERALAKDRDSRFDSMDQLVLALDGLAGAEAAKAAEDERAGSRARAMRWGALALAVTAVASAVVLARKSSQAKGEAIAPVSTAKARDAAVELSILGMVRLPGGTFTMGSSVAELDAECARLGKRCARQTLDREQPAREVHVSPFFLDVNETTNREFVEWLGNQRLTVRPDTETKAPRYIYDRANKVFLFDANRAGAHPSIVMRDDQTTEVLAGTEEQAAVGMTWDAASAYCTAHGKRLPTEAEFEFAAAGTARRRFPWGAEEPRCDGVVYGRDQDECVGMPKGPQPVTAGGQDWTPEGVHGLGGNVTEWVQDAFIQPFYPGCGECLDPVTKPAAGAEKEYRLLRGGSWWSTVNLVRAQARSPWERSSTARSAGFRCALTAVQ
ncbi:MAG TPA: SUMF1/EgtB/PvdO family nonheme iron enzyme, partial [Polyangiaceae bacterium]